MMQKFFFKFRSQNWINYFIELIIVFLGVSLAFYMNKRAEVSKFLEQEKFYLANILDDLSEDDVEIPFIIDQIDEELKKIKNIGDRIKERSPALLDSVVNPAVKLSYTSNYHPEIQTFQTLTQSGEALKITNFELRDALAGYYSYFETLEARHQDFNAVKTEKLFPFLTEHYNFYQTKTINSAPFYGDQLQNILFELFKYAIAKKNSYEKTLQRLKRLKLEVERELKKFE